MVFLNVAHMVTLAAYGWLLQKRVHVSGPMILQFILGGLETCIVQWIFSKKHRALRQRQGTLCDAGWQLLVIIAGLKPLMSRIGNGWYFTMLSIIGFVFGSAGTITLRRFGMK
ncbi:hypothetical protein F4823DRAFT_51941 [Ustulina deusta]|nr:hypothetical protein F4823DRAFT_51941 [Ustulina deusta]